MYLDRKEAGIALGHLLLKYKNHSEAIVIALPRGGVVIGYEIAKILHLPLDIVVPRKIAAPFNEELAIGAICENESYFDQSLIDTYLITKTYLERKIEEQKTEAERRLTLYRKNLKPLNLTNQIVLLVDDGIATGATMIASLKYVLKQKPKKVIVAVPIASKETLEEIKKYTAEIICPHAVTNLMSISQGYVKFEQVSDDTVIEIMKEMSKRS